MSRPFSTASIKLVADELSVETTTSVEQVLKKLLHIDSQIDRDFKALESDLGAAHEQIASVRADLSHEKSRREQLQKLSDQQAYLIVMLKNELQQLSLAQHANPQDGEKRRERIVGKAARINLNTSDQKENHNCCNQGSVHIDSSLPDCEDEKAVLANLDSQSLYILLCAREQAFRSQQTLVDRLKSDNQELKATYDKLWARYQRLYDKKAEEEKGIVEVNERIEHLSFRVQQAGTDACNVASQVEQRLQLTAKGVQEFRTTWRRLSKFSEDLASPKAGPRFSFADAEIKSEESVEEVNARQIHVDTPRKVLRDEYDDDEFSHLPDWLSDVRRENEELDLAGAELLQTLTLQQEAHERLRSTVLELTKELERIEPNSVQEAKKCKEDLEIAERDLKEANSTLKERNSEIADLKRELKKVLAEYEAVSIAHSYSNAELSKIRATNRAKTKLDRQKNELPQRHGTVTTTDKHHHRRNHHFR